MLMDRWVKYIIISSSLLLFFLFSAPSQAASLSWNTFLGGTGQHLGYGVATDAAGNVYSVGLTNTTWDTNLFGDPVSAFGGSGYTDAVVAKLDSSGNLQWYTFLGVSTGDSAMAVKADNNGNVYVVGYTTGTWGSPVHAYNGGSLDGFVVKLDSSGNIVWNTFLGSTSSDYPYAIDLDDDGNIYVGGESYRRWASSFNNVIGTDKSSDGYQGWLAKLNSNGEYQWHRFLTTYSVYDVAVGPSGNVHTIKKGLYYSGGWNYPAQVGKYTAAGAELWSVSIGTGSQDGFGIAVDASGSVFIRGSGNQSWGSPIRAYSGGEDNYVAKLSGTDGSPTWNTFLGSSGTDMCRDNQGCGLSLDAAGNVYTTGYSSSTWGSPIIAHAGGSYDGFAVMLNTNGALQWSTFLGGTNMDTMIALMATPSGDVVVSGYTQQTSWGSPIKDPNCYYCQSVAKISNAATHLPAMVAMPNITVDKGDAITITGTCYDEDTGNTLTVTTAQTSGTSCGSISGSPDADTGGSVASSASCTAPQSEGNLVFTLTCSDGTTPVTDTVTVSVNAPPTANAQAVSTDEDIPKVITLTGSDPTDELTYIIATSPSNGSLSGTPPNVTYTPTAEYSGSDSFTFKVNDGYQDSSPATVSITVNILNDVPVMATMDNASVIEDATITITGTCTDVETGDTLTVTTSQTSGTSCGSITGSPDVGTGGSLASSATCTAPSVDSNSNLVFQTRCNDGTVNIDDTVTITVNAAPTANAQAVSTNEDTPKAITLVGSDPNSEGITYTVVSSPSHGALSGSAPNLTYTPTSEYNGSDSFTFKVNDSLQDSNTATVTLTIDPMNDAPETTDIDDYGVVEGETIDFATKCEDIDDGNTLTLSITQTSGTSCGVIEGSPVSDTDGRVDIEASCVGPQINDDTELVFRIRCNDGTVNDDATVTITENAAPTAVPKTVSTDEDTNISFTINGTDPSDSITYQKLTSPTQGTLTGTIPNYLYTPTPGFFGTDSFAFRVNDGSQNSNVATVTITVNSVNDPPVIEDEEDVVVDCSSGDCDLPDWSFTDPDAGQETTGTWAQVSGTGTLQFTDEGSLDLINSHPARGTYVIQYVVDDGIETTTSSAVTITLPNNPPAIVDENDIEVSNTDYIDTEFVFSEFTREPRVNVPFTDYDGDVLTYMWEADVDNLNLVDTTSCEANLCNMIIRMAGTLVVTVTTEDGFGGTTEEEIVIHIPVPEVEEEVMDLNLLDWTSGGSSTINVSGSLKSPVWPVVIINETTTADISLSSSSATSTLKYLKITKNSVDVDSSYDTYAFSASNVPVGSDDSQVKIDVLTNVDGENVALATTISSLGTGTSEGGAMVQMGAEWGCSLNLLAGTGTTAPWILILIPGILLIIRKTLSFFR